MRKTEREKQTVRKSIVHIILLFILAILYGCTDGKRAGADALPQGSDSAMRAKGYDEVKIFKSKTGHITTTLQLNGKPCVFLIDTGGGGTLIDVSKRSKFGLEALKTTDYVAGIGSVSPLVRTSATLRINEFDIVAQELYLMDISYLNAEFKKNHARQVDGILGTDFLDKHQAVIDYAQCKLYLKIKN
ncbi:MAG: aspartyl protease family protein [Prevotella sp.]|nr:aspartyl protease family protein [Prevotella sp.]